MLSSPIPPNLSANVRRHPSSSIHTTPTTGEYDLRLLYEVNPSIYIPHYDVRHVKKSCGCVVPAEMFVHGIVFDIRGLRPNDFVCTFLGTKNPKRLEIEWLQSEGILSPFFQETSDTGKLAPPPEAPLDPDYYYVMAVVILHESHPLAGSVIEKNPDILKASAQCTPRAIFTIKFMPRSLFMENAGDRPQDKLVDLKLLSDNQMRSESELVECHTSRELLIMESGYVMQYTDIDLMLDPRIIPPPEECDTQTSWIDPDITFPYNPLQDRYKDHYYGGPSFN